MSGLTKEEEVVRQVKLGKAGQFGLTGIKVELEAFFGRRQTSRVYDIPCKKCNGNDGWIIHTACDGNGCHECSGQGGKQCSGCYMKREEWNSDDYCQQWIMKELAKIGLATKKRDSGLYEAKQPLVYGRFYTDASVDAEFTFTINLNKPENIFLLPKVIDIWKRMGEAIGRGCDVRNAGMHIALLRNKKCYYPDSTDFTAEEAQCYHNFEKSMRLLMPALFFLGSSNVHSRGLRFREPKTSTSKYSAIHLYGNALEFRVFETCYDTPDAILDNFVVMRNCLRFWSYNYRNPKLEKITPSIKFGNDDNERIDRFYTTVKHLDLLSAGLVKIKPAYYTLKQLKEQRKFKVNKKEINKQVEKARKDAEIAYAEYDQRYEWMKEQDKLSVRLRILQRNNQPTPEQRAALLAEAESTATQHVQMLEESKQTAEHYIDNEVQKYINRKSGQFTLAVA